jgi:hypothetical protein
MPTESGGIQYSRKLDVFFCRRGVLDRPVEPGDDD